MKGIEKFKSGDFNTVNYNWQPDGSVVLLLSKREEKKLYRVKVKKLYEPDEELISDEEIEV